MSDIEEGEDYNGKTVQIDDSRDSIKFDVNPNESIDGIKIGRSFKMKGDTGTNESYAIPHKYTALGLKEEIKKLEKIIGEYSKENDEKHLSNISQEQIEKKIYVNSPVSKEEIKKIIKELPYINSPVEEPLSNISRLMSLYIEDKDYHGIIRTYKKFTQARSDNADIFEKEIKKFYQNNIGEQILEELSDDKITLYGNSPNQVDVFLDALCYATDDEPCLIIGETGTGKEYVAKMLHKYSLRKDNIFWAVNCGGFTESLFNSEIQGIVSGAATGVSTRLGAFLKACGSTTDEKNKGYWIDKKRIKQNIIEIKCKINGKSEDYPTWEQLHPIRGTLFLDEINSMPLGLQSSLLRIIEEKEVMVVGEDRKRPYAAKVVCATNKDITGNEQIDGFRQDLYYRISKEIIYLPPLRDMADSIPDICSKQIRDMCKKIGCDEIKISQTALEKLKQYHWPGNHRELKNVLHRAVTKMNIYKEKILKEEHLTLGRELSVVSRSQDLFEGKDQYDVMKMYVDYLMEREHNNKERVCQVGGFSHTKHVYEILDPSKKAYKTKRYINCDVFKRAAK